MSLGFPDGGQDEGKEESDTGREAKTVMKQKKAVWLLAVIYGRETNRKVAEK